MKLRLLQQIKFLFSIGGIKKTNFYADFNLLYRKKRQSRVIFKTETFL